MKVLLDIKVKRNLRLTKEIKKALENLSLARKGKLKLKTARELHHEL